MRCIVYRGRHGLLLVPDCMRASMEAERDEGPLLRCGEIETDRLDPSLVHDIDDALDHDLFARGDASLALRLAYEAATVLPLADGFLWRMSDFWNDDLQATIVHHASDTVVCELHAERAQWSWRVVTNTHRPWLFRQTYVATSRTVAMQYLAMWVADHAVELQRTLGRISGASTPAPSTPQ